jgi:hypothetical protein
MSEFTLVQLWKSKGRKEYPTDKGTSHHYLPIYDIWFAPFKNKEINLLEIGVKYGGSCKLWDDYFPYAKIRGIDITLENVRVKLSNRVTLEQIDYKNLTANYFIDFPPDIIIDDGSHRWDDQIHLINVAYSSLRPGGLIVIEDIYNLEEKLIKFEELGLPFDVVDLRNTFRRKSDDDVLIIFKKK